MTNSLISSLSQFGAVFTVQAGQRIPCAPSTSWGSSPSELEYPDTVSFEEFLYDLMNYKFEPSLDLDSAHRRAANRG